MDVINRSPSLWVFIPPFVRYSDVTDGAKLLYAELTGLSNARGYCWATNGYLGALMGQPEKPKDDRTVRRWIAELAGIGGLRVHFHEQPNGDSERRIWPLAHPFANAETPEVVEAVLSAATASAGGRAFLSGGADTDAGGGGHFCPPDVVLDTPEQRSASDQSASLPDPQHDHGGERKTVLTPVIEVGAPAKKRRAKKEPVRYPEESREYQAALYLFSALTVRGVAHVEALVRQGKQSETLHAWADTFEKMHRLDGAEWPDIGMVLKWLLEVDGFWIAKGNFQTAHKLREKKGEVLWHRIWLQAARTAFTTPITHTDGTRTGKSTGQHTPAGPDNSGISALRDRLGGAAATAAGGTGSGAH